MIDKNIANSKHFCILPWIHTRINQDGNLYPCCRTDSFYLYGSLKKNKFADIWNDAPIREMRNRLKNDEPISSCQDCYHIDNLGGTSMRKRSNLEFSDYLYLVDKTLKDGSLSTSELIFLDLRFSNICNFKCRSCNPTNSTSWYPDAKHFSGSVPNVIIKPTHSIDEIWSILEEQLPYLKRIYFAGGEPLLQDEHYELLEKLIQKNRTDIFLEYNTNLSTLEYKKWKALELWGVFSNVSIGASIDGIKEQGEILRKGMKWDNIIKNFNSIKNEIPQALLKVTPTLGVANSFHITEAIEAFIDLQMVINPEDIALNILNDPKYLSVHILNTEERAALKLHYSDFLSKLKLKTSPDLFKRISHLLNTVLMHLDSELVNEPARLNFKKFTLRLDKLREERLVFLFPELIGLIL